MQTPCLHKNITKNKKWLRSSHKLGVIPLNTIVEVKKVTKSGRAKDLEKFLPRKKGNSILPPITDKITYLHRVLGL